jgi:hypothetical protein
MEFNELLERSENPDTPPSAENPDNDAIDALRNQE